MVHFGLRRRSEKRVRVSTGEDVAWHPNFVSAKVIKDQAGQSVEKTE